MTATVPSREQAGLDRLLARAQQIVRRGDGPAPRPHPRLGPRCTSGPARPCPSGWSRPSRRAPPTRSTSPGAGAATSGTRTGSEYLDFHGGFGAMVVGPRPPPHRGGDPRGGQPGHPLRRDHRGGGGVRRGDLPPLQPRDAPLRQLRAPRPPWTRSGWRARRPGGTSVCKIEGSYHGHHDAVMFSVVPNADVMGGRERPAKAPVSKGLVKDAHRYIEVVPFNDADHLERLFDEKGQRDRLPHHGAGDDEHRHRAARSRATSSGSGSCAPGTA